jgi:adenosylcobinamide kinase/adenosylcobinamide-phosphate guanylyltransferase
MIVLVTGGSGSGKSEFAENLAVSYGSDNLIYIATMFPYDEEALKKIERHKIMRKDKKFITIECFTNLKKILIPKGTTVLLDCMSNLVANEMYQNDGAKEFTFESVLDGVKYIKDNADNFVIVTNEIFSDGIEYDIETKKYLSNLGKINVNIGHIADKIIEVVYTIPIYQKKENYDKECFKK